MNQEGYRDPTAEKAVQNAGRLTEHIWQPIKLIRSTLELVHLDLIEITVADRKSKRRYKWRKQQ
ncbi:MAG: hypothetical protein PUJ62_07585 [Lachnospiraceae bacterium]|nr:hypothetical protein [Lachnospiraceae bacterium]